MSTTRLAEPTSWLDVSCYVHQAELFRGRERFNERFEPGTASVTFSNADRLGRSRRHLRRGRGGRAAAGPARSASVSSARGTAAPTSSVGCTAATSTRPRRPMTRRCTTSSPSTASTLSASPARASPRPAIIRGSTRPSRPPQPGARRRRLVGRTKRKIAATATTVQGTELGAAAIDHMSQAADSAGGVVFGDLDGDVVFKDIDWMLYDPDTPPDDTIGNGPGGGGPGAPPYIDPTPGPVYDPDDPPAANPPKVCVCADGTAGTLDREGRQLSALRERRPSVLRVVRHDVGHGPLLGRLHLCRTARPRRDGGPPERSDDPDEDGDYEISPFPPVRAAGGVRRRAARLVRRRPRRPAGHRGHGRRYRPRPRLPARRR